MEDKIWFLFVIGFSLVSGVVGYWLGKWRESRDW